MCPKWSIWICVRVRLCAKLCPVSCASYNKVNPQYKYYVFRCALSFIRNVQAKIRSVFPSSALLFRPNSSSTVLFYWDRACHSFHIFFFSSSPFASHSRNVGCVRCVPGNLAFLWRSFARYYRSTKAYTESCVWCSYNLKCRLPTPHSIYV